MIPVFDIFRTEANGSVRWCEAANSLEDARNRIRELAEVTPAEYVILDQQTGQRVSVQRSDPISPKPASAAGTRGWYHICRVDKEKLRRVEAAETLQVAEARIKVLKAFYPGDYLVLDYNPERSDSPAPWTPLSVVLSALGL
jgi:hypothetical protein